MSEIVFYPEVDLLGVAIFEILCCGESKGLQQQREAGIEIVLVGEYRIRLEGIEALLIRQISEAGVTPRETTGIKDSLEKIGGVEIQRAASG